MKENPRIAAYDVLGNGHQTWLGVGGRLEDFMGYVSVGGEYNKPEKEQKVSITLSREFERQEGKWCSQLYILVEDRNAAKRSAGPLGKISFKLRVQCLEKRADEWYLECRPSYWPFSLDVHDYFA